MKAKNSKSKRTKRRVVTHVVYHIQFRELKQPKASQRKRKKTT